MGKHNMLANRLMIIAGMALWLCACDRDLSGNAQTEPTTSRKDSPATKIDGANGPSGGMPSASRYTSIDPQRCKLLEENVDEGGWWLRKCEGLAGYRLEISESDLRQDIVVIAANGRRSELGLSGIVANGAFNSLGKSAEWRGADPASPEALIVRLDVNTDPVEGRTHVSNLVVARLEPVPCVVAIVPPGIGQNERARAIADGTLPPCLKP